MPPPSASSSSEPRADRSAREPGGTTRTALHCRSGRGQCRDRACAPARSRARDPHRYRRRTTRIGVVGWTTVSDSSTMFGGAQSAAPRWRRAGITSSPPSRWATPALMLRRRRAASPDDARSRGLSGRAAAARPPSTSPSRGAARTSWGLLIGLGRRPRRRPIGNGQTPLEFATAARQSSGGSTRLTAAAGARLPVRTVRSPRRRQTHHRPRRPRIQASTPR